MKSKQREYVDMLEAEVASPLKLTINIICAILLLFLVK